jgi:hypothetical protein
VFSINFFPVSYFFVKKGGLTKRLNESRKKAIPHAEGHNPICPGHTIPIAGGMQASGIQSSDSLTERLILWTAAQIDIILQSEASFFTSGEAFYYIHAANVPCKCDAGTEL